MVEVWQASEADQFRRRPWSFERWRSSQLTIKQTRSLDLCGSLCVGGGARLLATTDVTRHKDENDQQFTQDSTTRDNTRERETKTQQQRWQVSVGETDFR